MVNNTTPSAYAVCRGCFYVPKKFFVRLLADGIWLWLVYWHAFGIRFRQLFRWRGDHDHGLLVPR